jgi:hypothetical protein
LTDVPVIGIPTKCIKTKLNPMDRPANPLGALSLVEPKTTKTNIRVRTTSAMKADAIEKLPGDARS